MTELVPFDFHEHRIRIVMIESEPWFVLNDVCAAIEIQNSRNAAQRLESGDVRTADIPDDQGVLQKTNVVNESGLYDLIFVSRKPAAKEFKRKVTTEILPEIRRSGVYLGGITLQDALRRYADALDEKDKASQRAIAAEAYANELRPQALEWQAYMDSDGTCDLGALAQALGGGRQRLVDRLRELAILVSKGASQGGIRPMQQYSEHEAGWFKVRMEATNVGPVHVSYATPKGVSGVYRALIKHGIGERRWGALPSEEELFKRVSFADLETDQSTE